MSVNLNPEKALIFRIVHVANVPWIMDNGIQCANSDKQDPHYVSIGNADLIDRRSRRTVPVPPRGTLSDYVPFYFTPFSMMMYKIKTGHGGIKQQNNRDIVIFVSSVHHLEKIGATYLFTNQHAYPPDTDFYNKSSDLDKIDWGLLRSKNFKTDDSDPGKQLRYQAEVLVHRQVPLEALLGVGCHDDNVCTRLRTMIEQREISLKILTTPKWYF